MATARELQDHDPDGSVNRSYYAMFDIARAALLNPPVAIEQYLARLEQHELSGFVAKLKEFQAVL